MRCEARRFAGACFANFDRSQYPGQGGDGAEWGAEGEEGDEKDMGEEGSGGSLRVDACQSLGTEHAVRGCIFGRAYSSYSKYDDGDGGSREDGSSRTLRAKVSAQMMATRNVSVSAAREALQAARAQQRQQQQQQRVGGTVADHVAELDAYCRRYGMFSGASPSPSSSASSAPLASAPTLASAPSLTSAPGASSSSSRKRWLACVGGAALLMRWSVARDLVAPEVVEAYCGLALPKGDAEAIGVCTGSMLCGVVPLGRGGPVCELGVRAWVVAEAER